MKKDIVDANGQPIFPVRKLECLEISYSEDEKAIHRLLRDFTISRTKTVKGTRFEFGNEFLHMLLKKRLFSSPLAFAITLSKHKETLLRGRAKNVSALDDRILRKAIAKSEEDYSNETKAEEAQLEAIEFASEMTLPLSDSERTMLDNLTDWAEKDKSRVDAKAKAIISWLENHLKSNGHWNEKRVILFTEYRATHVWLHQILTANGYGGNRLAILHGSMRPDEREAIKAAFQTHPNISPVRILLATDAASEGIDLQNHCNYMIHVEIPWNPNVMEQRNGRIDRHGQREKEVFIWHPVSKGFDPRKISTYRRVGEIEGDNEYLMRAALKVDTIREDLGSVGYVIEKQIEEAMLGRRNELDTGAAEVKAAKMRRFVASERKLQERIARLHEKLIETKTDFHLTPENVLRTVRIALELAGKPPLKSVSLPGIPEGKAFEVPVLPGSWGRATIGLEHPHTGVRRPITFDHEIAKGRDDVVLVHLEHKLVQMSLRLLREEIWKLDDVKLLHRVSVGALSDDELDRPIVAVWSRLVITGGGHHRLHEELTLSGGELEHNSFKRVVQIGKLEELVGKAEQIVPDDRILAVLKDRFERHEEAIRATVEARSRDRLKYLESTLARRKESEIEDLMDVLDDLAKSIEKELSDPGPQLVQLTLWSEEERNQLKRDKEAMKARLARIPEEKKNEALTIESRYADPRARTFPVAIVFLIPREMVHPGYEKL